jgi:hypothetical protein
MSKKKTTKEMNSREDRQHDDDQGHWREENLSAVDVILVPQQMVSSITYRAGDPAPRNREE